MSKKIRDNIYELEIPTDLDPKEISKDLVDSTTKVRVEIISTYENKIKPKIKKRLEAIPSGEVITPAQWIVQMDMTVPPVEFFVLANIISLFQESHVPMKDLIKLSLAYTFLDPEVAENYKDHGFGFVHRCNSKYYFQPDQRDELEEFLVKKFGIASKTKPFRELYPSICEDREWQNNTMAGNHYGPLEPCAEVTTMEKYRKWSSENKTKH